MDKTEQLLLEGWRFHFGECEDAWYQGYDDSAFLPVTIPHDWAVTQPFSKKYSSGTGYLAGGIGWYRLHFTIPEEYRGKSIRLVFDGVYKNSQVWVNSYYQGKHPYGYTGFSYDISEIAHFGGAENVVSVKVTHTDLADSRWFTGSGITRKVTLVAEEPLHLREDGSYVVTEQLTEEAVLSLHYEVENRGGEDAAFRIVTRLYQDENQLSAVYTHEVRVKARGLGSFVWREQLHKPELWSVEHPALYRMETWFEVEKQDGAKECYLADTQKIGIRTAEFDADRGFFLNGTSIKLKGVCLHHDAGCLGAAVTKEVWRRRLEKLKACGCNAIRCSHNPHMPELYDLCDEMGFVMMDEAFDEWENAKNKWSTGHNVYPPKHQGYFEDFPQWHEKDLRAMVRRDRRHPAVILWSIGNEIDYPNDPYCHPSFRMMTGNNDANKPAAERQYDPAKPDMGRLVTIAGELAQIVKAEDTSRPVTMALAYPELSAKIGVLEHLDVAGYNYKEAFYETDHRDFPNIPFLGSENGHSYEAWLAVKENEYISGQFLWTGIDYLGEAHGWPVHGSGAGILDCAGFEKSRYFRRKSLWCDEPVLALATRKWDGKDEEWIPCEASWNYEPGEKIVVMCYSNLPQVELLLNGAKVAEQKGYNADGAYQFTVFFKEGCIEAAGYDMDGKKIMDTRIETTGGVTALGAEVYVENVPQKEREPRIGYLSQIEVALLDDEGRRVTGEDCMVKVQVSGAGELAGIENGDLADVTAYSQNSRRTNEGRLLAFVRRTQKGRITVKFTAFPKGNHEGGIELEIPVD